MDDLQIIRLESTSITGWNFAELKAELKKELDTYAGLLYTDDTIKYAKKDRATLNKVKKVIEDARKAYKSKCLKPYEALEPQIKELTDMVDERRAAIDGAVKSYEARQKEAKEQEIRKYYDRKAAVLGPLAEQLFDKLFDSKWANASTARAKYEEQIQEAIHAAQRDIEKIRAVGSPFVDDMLRTYAQTLSLDSALKKNDELTEAARRAGLTEIPASQQAEPKTATVNPEGGILVNIHASEKQFKQICDFMTAIGVRYELL